MRPCAQAGMGFSGTKLQEHACLPLLCALCESLNVNCKATGKESNEKEFDFSSSKMTGCSRHPE